MNAKSKSIKSNLKKIDRHIIQPKEYEELPELTDEMFERSVYKVAGIEKPSPRKHGKQKTATKVPVSVRLPREVVSYFREEGAGWQTKIGSILRSWIKSHPRTHSHDQR